jgi:hypothetical protein
MLSAFEPSPAEFDFEQFSIQTTGDEYDVVIARRLILIMTDLELIYRVGVNSSNFYITSELRDLGERILDTLDF